MPAWVRYVKQAFISLIVMVVARLCIGYCLLHFFDWEKQDVIGLLRIVGATIFIATWFLQVAFSGNRRVSNVGRAERESALSSPPPEAFGLIYVLRTGWVGKAAGLDVVMDGQTVAQLKSPRFTRLVVAPGTHVLAIHNNIRGFGKTTPSELTFTLAAGETAVFSFVGQGAMRIVRETDLRAALGKLSTITMVKPEQDAIANPGVLLNNLT